VPASAAPLKPAPNWLRKDTKPAATSLSTRNGPSPLRVGGMLLLVSALGGVAFYARRRRQQANAPAQVKPQLRVLGSTRIGPKASAVVVEVAGKRILLGVTEHAVNNLAWLDDDANQAVEEREASRVHTAPAVRPSAAPEAAGPSGFLKLLRSAVGTNAARPVTPSDEIARATRDEVRLSHRGDSALRRERAAASFDDELLEGQVMGLVKRRKDPS
jgi:flagellar biogenesis protein FliO